MSINCEIVGVIPFPLTPGDEFRVDFDISVWLEDATISSVVYSATDEYGEDVTATVLPGGDSNTPTILRPYLNGGVANNSYTAKMVMTASDSSIKTFYIKWSCREVAS